jgi:plasmid maintenance system antidote protein VapI
MAGKILIVDDEIDLLELLEMILVEKTPYQVTLRLSKYFGQSERFWMNIQTPYDLEIEKDRLEGHLEHEVKILHLSRLAQAPV